jgi:hypothetical protein
MLRRGVLSDVWFSWDDIVDVTADGTPHGLRTLAIRATSAQTGGLLRIIRRPPVRDRPPRWPLLVGGLALSASELAGLVGRCIGDSRVREAMGTSAGLAEVETVDRDPPWPLRNDVIWALGHLRRIALIGVGLVVIAVIGAPVIDGLWFHSGSSRATQTLVATTFACFMAPVIEMPESRLDFIQRLGVRRSALWAVAVLGWWIVAIGGAFLVAGALGFNG